MSRTLLQMEDVALGYTEEPVLTGVELHIAAGELVVIAGVSGCGKSTLLKGGVGLLQPMAGRVQLLGEDLAGMDEGRLVELRSRVGLLFQGGALINSMTVAENVALPLEHHTRLSAGAITKLVQMKLAMVGLEQAWSKAPDQLSGGMRKRAALARAMALDPDLLLCDEPSAGLDPITAAALDRLLLEMRASLGVTLVVVTHELTSIEAIADRIVMVADGGIVFDGPLDAARQSDEPAVRDFLERRASRPETAGRSMLQRFAGPGQPTLGDDASSG